MKPKPQRLLMNLLTAMDEDVLRVRDAISLCELFGVTSNSTRVALTRLSAEGLIESCGRGQYQLTARAHTLTDDLRRWRTALQRLEAWTGQWVAAHLGGLGRSDKPALRRRKRALEMNGFQELSRDLYIRPDNLRGGVASVRERLYRLGLEGSAPVFLLSHLDDHYVPRARNLWDTTGLEQRYRDTASHLRQWLDQADRLSPEAAARESFVIGDRAIRQIVFDPLLPEQMIDATARQTFVDTLLTFDQTGHAIWRRLYHLSAGTTAPT
ncbi:PaaX family transcriptional regulator [Marinobacter halodurans]|uniref:PaaX family transcriptional regulator n=1 Tax=Marinobacter halodurans TaxID=2528979 RepID=A0ABY1ZRT9_9GAMM|nr:PaaX family transcriptional regulator C-terminal domain-containing protein [Marinobacter halodurans]TBW58584.1 PaaX family transcriptional regulator [Marinobacter halodurans]